MKPYQDLLDILAKEPYIKNKEIAKRLRIEQGGVDAMLQILKRGNYIVAEKLLNSDFKKVRKIEVLKKTYTINRAKMKRSFPEYRVTSTSLFQMFYSYFLENYHKKDMYYMQMIYILTKEIALYLEQKAIIRNADLPIFTNMKAHMDDVENEKIDKKINEVYA